MSLRRQGPVAILVVAFVAACGGSSNGPIETSAHRPAPMEVSGQPAPAEVSAPLLRPVDLGPTWRYRTNPVVEMKPESTPAPGQPITGEISRAQEILWASHWNGTRWQDDADIIEYAVHFAAAADGLHFMQGHTHPIDVAGHRVWTFTKDGHQGGPDSALFDIGTTVIQLIIGHSAAAPASTPSTQQVLIDAVHRAFGSS